MINISLFNSSSRNKASFKTASIYRTVQKHITLHPNQQTSAYLSFFMFSANADKMKKEQKNGQAQSAKHCQTAHQHLAAIISVKPTEYARTVISCM